MISYWCAWIKVHYPVEFITACLIHSKAEQDVNEKIALIINDAFMMGLNVLPPSVERGNKEYTIVDDRTIAFGYDSIKNIGSAQMKKVLKLYKTNRWETFLKDIINESINKKVVESLVYSGALDCFNKTKKDMLIEYETIKNLTEREFDFVNKDLDSFSVIEAIKHLVDLDKLEGKEGKARCINKTSKSLQDMSF